MKITLLIFIVVVIVAAFLLRKINPMFEKYWKYVFILLPVAVFLFLMIIKKKPNDSQASQIFADKISEVKNNMQEASDIAQAKTEMIKTDQKEKLQKLDEITKISDENERRAKLAEFINQHHEG
jgi:glucan phosphoethanolaminetransferase (alkaline phosphatase superfamily)